MAGNKYELRFALDFSLTCLLLVILLVLKKGVTPVFRGMYCNDATIAYPYVKAESVSDTILILTGISFPVVVICIVEYVKSKSNPVSRRITICGKRVHSSILGIYSYIGMFLFGETCVVMLTEIGKLTIGRLRPHFIEVCSPDWSKINCTNSEYIDPIPCLNDDMDLLIDARKSFPSAHSSFSAFAMVYLAIYLQKRMRIKVSYLFRPVLQFFFLSLAFYTTLSRISDYHHHWSDTLFGFVLGAVFAVLTVYTNADLFDSTDKLMTKGNGQSVLQNDCEREAELAVHD